MDEAQANLQDVAVAQQLLASNVLRLLQTQLLHPRRSPTCLHRRIILARLTMLMPLPPVTTKEINRVEVKAKDKELVPQITMKGVHPSKVSFPSRSLLSASTASPSLLSQRQSATSLAIQTSQTRTPTCSYPTC